MSSSVLMRFTEEIDDSATNPIMSSSFDVSSVVVSELSVQNLIIFRNN